MTASLDQCEFCHRKAIYRRDGMKGRCSEHGSSLLPTPDGGIELHRRDVFTRSETHWPICSCGFIGVPQISWGLAASVPCDVEVALAESQERRRRILGVSV